MAAIFLTVNGFIYPFGRMTTFLLSRQWLNNRIRKKERHQETGGDEMGF